ncbi:MAG TPA: PAS domain S-box protein [Flavisolibacter sp.]
MKSATTYPFHLQKLILENVSDIIIITDLEFVIQSWNRVATQFYGIDEAVAIGKKMGDVVSFTYHGSTQQEAFIALQTNKIWQGEVSFTNQKGEKFYFLQTVKFALDEEGKESGILAVGRDITGRVKAEEQLRESEKFYRALIADSLDVTLLLNGQGEISFVTGSLERLLGYKADEILNTNAFQYIHPEDLAWAMNSFEKEVEESPEIKFIIIRVLKKNGEWLWCMARGHNLLANPHVNAIVVYLHDDTPRKKATTALQESEKLLRSLIRDLPTGVLLQDGEGQIVMTNQATCRMFHVSEKEVLGGRIWELYTDVIHEDGAFFLRSERPSFKAIQTKKLVKDVVMGVWNKHTKERIWIIITADPILNEAGDIQHVVCSFTDITQIKKLEKKSFAEKMAHQQQLSQATIDGQEKERQEIGKELHDNIGQQLTTVKLQLDFAKSNTQGEAQRMVETALKGVSEIINEVRSISRSLVPSTLKDLGFIDSLNDLIESLQHTQAILIELDYFEFDEDQLPDNKKLSLFRIVQEQLNNIIKHAKAKKVTIQLRSTGKVIMLLISDDGKGFNLVDIRRGVGLTNIINRAELFGGGVEILTSPGKGCDLKVWIPYTAVNTVTE